MNEKPLTSCKKHGILRVRMATGRPVCTVCRHRALDRWQKDPRNKEKLARWGKDWRDKNGPRAKYLVRRAYLKKKYGLSHEAFEAMDAKQGSACAICRLPSGNGHNLHIDHDHATGKIRGLLCGHCNRGLGHYRDNAELLRKAAEYLLQV